MLLQGFSYDIKYPFFEREKLNKKAKKNEQEKAPIVSDDKRFVWSNDLKTLMAHYVEAEERVMIQDGDANVVMDADGNYVKKPKEPTAPVIITDPLDQANGIVPEVVDDDDKTERNIPVLKPSQYAAIYDKIRGLFPDGLAVRQDMVGARQWYKRKNAEIITKKAKKVHPVPAGAHASGGDVVKKAKVASPYKTAYKSRQTKSRGGHASSSLPLSQAVPLPQFPVIDTPMQQQDEQLPIESVTVRLTSEDIHVEPPPQQPEHIVISSAPPSRRSSAPPSRRSSAEMIPQPMMNNSQDQNDDQNYMK